MVVSSGGTEAVTLPPSGSYSQPPGPAVRPVRRFRRRVGSWGGLVAVIVVCLAAVAGLPQPARGSSLTLTPSNWAAGCGGVATSARYNTPPTTTGGAGGGYDDTTTNFVPSLLNGGEDENLTVAVPQTSYTTSSTTAEAQTTQFFFVGPYSSGGCYSPQTSHSVTVSYTWSINGAFWASNYCLITGSYSWSMQVYLLANIHSTAGFVQGTHSQYTIFSKTGGYSYCSTGHLENTEYSTFGPQTYTVSTSSDALSNTVSYDFFTTLVVDLSVTPGTTGTTVTDTWYDVAALQSVSCPAC